MKKITLLLLLLFSVYGSAPKHVDTRFVGIVAEVKILAIDEQENIAFWIKADKEFIIQGRAHIPYIYVGDSLYEYWIDHTKVGIGTPSDKIIYEILESNIRR